MKKMRKFRDYLMEKLSELDTAMLHLEVVLEEYQNDGDAFGFLIGLRCVVEAQGGVNRRVLWQSERVSHE